MNYVVDANPTRILEAFGQTDLGNLDVLMYACAAFVVAAFVRFMFSKG